MVNLIAKQLFDWVKEIGPTNGDAYDQERCDYVCDFLGGYSPSPVTMAPGEEAIAIANSEDVHEEIDRLMDEEVKERQGWWYDEHGILHLCNGPQVVV
jgi:hypothetical protein